MKKHAILLALLVIFKIAYAQEISLDKEKLLEFYQTQRYAEAATYLASIYPAETTDVKALTQIAYCNMMAGKLVDAEKNYQKINELQPQQIPILFSLANINSRRGNTRNASDYLQQVVKLDSNNFNAYKRLADYTDSAALKLQYLQKANKLNATEADVAFDLARVHRNDKRYQQAYNVLKIAIAADTSNLILQQALLPIANFLSKYNEVVVAGEKLIKNGADANVVVDVAKAYFFLKNYKKAISLYQMLEKKSMQNESTLYFTSLSYRELKNYEMAAAYAKRTIDESISPNISAYYNVLGGIYDEKHQLTQAINAYKKGLTYSANKNIQYRLALLYDLKLKQTKSAQIYYNQFLKNKALNDEDKAQVDYIKARLEEFKPVAQRTSP
ncbi:MAG: tetratricopeptide repeat protein [Pedobacter sp.]